MSEVFRKIMNFLRFTGLILADKGKIGDGKKRQLLSDYFFLKLLTCLPIIIKRNITHIELLGNKFGVFDLQTSVAIIESIFIENEYSFLSGNKSPLIYDLGSNIGLSVLYFKVKFPNSRVISFEPDPTTFNQLSENILLNNLRKISINNKAVSDINGEINFYIDKDGPGSPLMSIEKKRLPKDNITVNSTKLSKYIKEPVDLIKMDIEGAEQKVIAELAKEGKLKLIKQLVIEYHHHIDSGKDNFSKFLSILESNNFGYQIHASQKPPFSIGLFEDLLIYAYNKNYFQPKN